MFNVLNGVCKSLRWIPYVKYAILKLRCLHKISIETAANPLCF